MLGFGIFGRSPMGTVPFLIKLVVCLILDFIGLAWAGAWFASLVTPFLNFFGITVGVGVTVAYAIFQGFIMFIFYSFTFFFPISFLESMPILNWMPWCTIICLWNGFKTRWKY